MSIYPLKGDYTELKCVDFNVDWHTKIYLTLDNIQVKSALDKAKLEIAKNKHITEDITDWPIVLLYQKGEDGSLYYFNQILELLGTTSDKIIEDYSQRPNEMYWYLINHYCFQMSTVWLEMARLAYPDGVWNRYWCLIDGDIHITVADTLNKRIFDLQLWMFGYI